jgi:hypothetical protein
MRAKLVQFASEEKALQTFTAKPNLTYTVRGCQLQQRIFDYSLSVFTAPAHPEIEIPEQQPESFPLTGHYRDSARVQYDRLKRCDRI